MSRVPLRSSTIKTPGSEAPKLSEEALERPNDALFDTQSLAFIRRAPRARSSERCRAKLLPLAQEQFLRRDFARAGDPGFKPTKANDGALERPC